MEFTIFPHEIVADILLALASDRKEISGLKRIDNRGTAVVTLEDGVHKSPDFGHFDPNMLQGQNDANIADYRELYPTVVWEVAYSQRSKKLARDCGRWIACSGGNTNLAIATDIDSTPVAQGRKLNSITLSEWVLLDYLEDDKETTPDQCDVLRRKDGLPDDDSLLSSPIAKEYLFSTIWKKSVVTWLVGVGTSRKEASHLLVILNVSID